MRGAHGQKPEEIARLHDQSLSELSPSVRDFALYISTQRRELAVIARVQHSDPETGRSWPARDLVAYAAACDAAEVAALAVVTSAPRGSLELLAAVASRTQAPILRDDLTLDPLQIYDARLHGADAVVLPAADLDDATLAELVRAAGSLHLASVVEVQSSADLTRALALRQVLIGISADPAVTRRLAQAVPAHRTVIALRDPGDLAAIRSLRGEVDAVVVAALLLDSPQVAATLGQITGS
ncbi:MAG: hypothetical protein HY699_09680 [Deltaproteobacteria bacterium]|nr:hypothetical protein [Deltaproteobacteria bacterium]